MSFQGKLQKATGASGIPVMALARGSILAGNSSGIGAALNAKTEAQILVGDGTDVKSVALSGDISMTAAGAVTVGTVGAATAAEVAQASDLSAQDSMTPGAGFAGTGTIVKSSVVKHGGIIKTEILLDLTGAASSTTDLDIIGTSGVSHIGQITAAKNGTIMYGQVSCLETPAGGVADIDLYKATAATGAFDAAVTGLAGQGALLTKGGTWAASVTPVIMSALPAANDYLYLTGGAAGTAASYSAGRLLIEFWGV